MAVPIAINAVVLAHTQSEMVQSVVPPVLGSFPTQLDITVDQAAQLLSSGGAQSGGYTWDGPLGQGLLTEDPDLANDIDGPAGFPGGRIAGAPIVATSGTDATTLFTTAFLNALAPATDLISNAFPATGTLSGQLGVNSNFGIVTTANPTYYVKTFTGNALMTKDLAPLSGSEWALTNTASAAATWGGLADFAIQTPDSIGSSTPTYVAANPQNMDAAVSEMTPQPDGTLLPNLNATPVNGVEPYPLTYVEYAIVPTQPLLNADCSARTQSQQDLIDWLNYIVGYGQTNLPAGMVQLTPALVADAQAAIAKVGQAAPACTPTTTAPAPSATSNSGSGTGSSDDGSFGSGSIGLSSFGVSDLFGAGSGVVNPSTSTTGAGTSNSANSSGKKAGSSSGQTAVDLTRFTAHSNATWVAPLIGLLVLGVVLPMFVLAASGTSLRLTLAELGAAIWPRERRKWRRRTRRPSRSS